MDRLGKLRDFQIENKNFTSLCMFNFKIAGEKLVVIVNQENQFWEAKKGLEDNFKVSKLLNKVCKAASEIQK